MFFQPLIAVKECRLGTLSAYQSKMIEDFKDKHYKIDIIEKKQKEINGRSYMFVHYYIYSAQCHHRSMFAQLYVPYDELEQTKLTYQVLGEPNGLRSKTLDYIFARFKNAVHVPAFSFVGIKEGPVRITFGGEKFLYNSKTQARKLFPAQAVGFVNSTLPEREKKAILNNLVSKELHFEKYYLHSHENIKKKIIDFLSVMKLDNIMSDHDIYQAFCEYYKPYDTYLLYKFL